MRRVIFALLLILSFTAAPLFRASAQVVYFQRTANSNGSVSVALTTEAFDPTDIVTGIVVNASGGVAFDGASTIYFSDTSGGRVLATDKNGVTQVIIDSSALVLDPGPVAIDTQNRLLFVYSLTDQIIYRADISGTLPVTAVSTFAHGALTSSVTDMKYNWTDGMLYWLNSGMVLRASGSGSVPVLSPDQFDPQLSSQPQFLDFDSESPQNIYLGDIGVSEGGVYSAPLPATATGVLNDTLIFDSTGFSPFLTVAGLAVERGGTTFCISASEGGAASIRCGSRSTPQTMPQIVADPGDSSVLASPPAYLAIEGSQVVSPSTQLSPPLVAVDTAERMVRLTLQKFSGAVTRREAATRATSGRLGFRYQVELRRTGTSTGAPIPGRRERDRREKITRRNEVTFRRLKADSTYRVRYRVQITRKERGKDPVVVKRTRFSAAQTFTIP